MNISGDPTFFSQGTLSVNSPLVFSAPITIFGGKDVIITDKIQSAGNPITIIAGTNITAKAGTDTFPNQIQSGLTITSSGPSGDGGDVVVAAGGLVDSSSTTGKGGKIQLAAYQFGGNGGAVTFNGGGQAGSGGSGAPAGDITIIAPGVTQDNKLNLDADSSVGSPKITIIGAQPSGKVTADAKGNAGTIGASTVAAGGTTVLETVLARSGNIKVSADTVIVQLASASGAAGGNAGVS